MTSCAQEFAWFSSDSPTNHNSAVMNARRHLKKSKNTDKQLFTVKNSIPTSS